MPQMSEQQLRAVEFTDGVLLLLAGPGSGKTFVLTHRILNLIRRGKDPSHILVITFTKAAALQMKERFLKLASPDAPEAVFGTFHAVFYNILRSQPAYRRMTPVTEKEKLNILGRVLEIIPYKNVCRDNEERFSVLSLISSCKNNGNDAACFEQEMLEPEVFTEVFDEYNRLLYENELLDFDDMINLCLDSLRSDPSVLKKWQSAFSYILIDEFQDISSNQYELVKLLAYPENNIFAVGDDDQSIYSFRGARVELMERLLGDYEGAQKAYLSSNYRCCGAIVERACDCIGDNKKRFKKDIVSGRDRGAEVKVISVNGEERQDEKIVEILQSTDRKTAILTRTNRIADRITGMLRMNGIKCISMTQTAPFSSEYVKDMCAFLAIASGEKDRSHYLRVINKPSRFVSRTAMPGEYVEREELLRFYRADAAMMRRLRVFFDGIDRIKRMPPTLAIRYIRNVMEYDSYVKEKASYESFCAYCDEMKRFSEFAKGCGDYYELEDRLKLYRESMKEDPDDSESEAVTVMTYHASKGLEFDTVILPDANENICPSRSAHSQDQVEEERRMFYVAMTRAKDELYILYRSDEGRKPSRFLKIKDEKV